MAIILISSNDSLVNIVPKLKQYLKKEIINVEVSEIITDSALDIPKIVKDYADEELIFAFVLLKKGDYRLPLIAKYLIDFEAATSAKLLKGIEETPSEKENDYSLDELEDELYKKYRKEIMTVLFGKEMLKKVHKRL